MKIIKIVTMSFVTSCSLFLTNNAMEIVKKKPKCVSLGGDTTFDLLMKADDSVFDRMIDYIDLGVGDNHVQCNGIVLDFESVNLIKLAILCAVQRNMPVFISMIMKATEEKKISLEANGLLIDCFYWAIVLGRIEIINIFLEHITACVEYGKAAEQGLAAARIFGGESVVQDLSNHMGLQNFLTDFRNHYGGLTLDATY